MNLTAWIFVLVIFTQESSAALLSGRDCHQSRCRLFVSSADEILTNDGDKNVSPRITAGKAEAFRKKRNPSFPNNAYSLDKDEQTLKHNYISFIDQSIFSEYSQTVRLVEPRMYARPDQFRKENLSRPPTVEDVAEPASCKISLCAATGCFRVDLMVVASCLMFLFL
jgi:hypothetical protein